MKRYEDLEQDDGTVVRYRRHDNGDGLVAVGAQVAPSAYVAATAWVDPGATVEPQARVGGYVWVQSGAVVRTGARLGTHVVVGRGALVGAHARLGGWVTLGERSRVQARAVVAPEETVPAGEELLASAARAARRAA